MTETEVNLNSLKDDILHLAEVTEQGWVLKWGDSPANTFELLCRGANAAQVSDIDRLLTAAHLRASKTLLPTLPE